MSTLQQRHAELERSHNELRELHAQVERERDEYRKLYELVREEAERLRRGLLGQKRERLPDDARQLTMQMLGLALQSDTAEAEVPTQEIRSHERKKPTGRKPLPETLPVVRVELKPVEVEKQGTDAFVRIGEDVSEVLERRPASMVRVQVVRGKYIPKEQASAAATEVLIHPTLELPIERGLAGPGMLADTIVRRWEDHAPLNRLERIYARDGVELARSTLCGWHEQLAYLAQPLVLAMLEDAYTLPYLCTDATGVLVQAKGKCKNGHFWVLVAPERHVLFRYSPRHDSLAVDNLLKGYKGYLVADAHAVYDHLYRSGDITEAGCWAHARRYFFTALDTDPERAKHALALIAKLFSIERGIAGAPRKKRHDTRKKASAPIVERFFEWCEQEVDLVLDESPIAKAIGYARNQQQALGRFLGDWRLPIHNNDSERALRREVVGRKNWLFIGSEDGALANTTFVSLLASCRMHELEPWTYLRDLLCLLPSWPVSKVLDLAPVNWGETSQTDDVQRRLEENHFRRATMMMPDSHSTEG